MANSDLDYPYDYNNSGSPYHYHGQIHYNSGNGNSTNKQLVGIVGLFLIGLLGISIYQNDIQLQDQLQTKNVELDTFAEHAEELENKLSKLRQQTRFLNEKMEQLQDEPAPVDLETHRRMFHLKHSEQMMKDQIQATSKRLLLEK